MTESTEFIPKIELTPGGKQETFPSISDFEQWLNIEKSFWVWPSDLQQKDRSAHSFINSNFLGKIRNLESHISNIKNNKDPNAILNQKNQLINNLKEYYTKKQLIHSTMPEAQFVKVFLDSDPILAAYILKGFVERDVPFNFDGNANSRCFAGIALASLFIHGMVKDTALSERKAVEEIRNTAQSTTNEIKGLLEQLKKDHETVLDQAEQNKNERNVSYDEWIKKAQADYESLINDSQKELKAIEDTYDKKLALHSSIKYWQGKFWIHVVSAGVLTIAVVVAFYWAARSMQQSVHELIGVTKLQDLEAWKIGAVLLIATISVWVIRILIRLLLSQIHLWSDAIERRTMILTYLALLREKDNLPEKSRDLILQTLFRPASTGIVRDDGVPPFMAVWLKRITGND